MDFFWVRKKWFICGLRDGVCKVNLCIPRSLAGFTQNWSEIHSMITIHQFATHSWPKFMKLTEKNCALLLKVCSGCWFSKVREISSHNSAKLRPPRDLKLSQRLLIMFKNVAKFWFLDIRSRFFSTAVFLLKAYDFAGCDRLLGPQSDKNWELGKNKILRHFRSLREQPLLISAPHSL